MESSVPQGQDPVEPVRRREEPTAGRSDGARQVAPRSVANAAVLLVANLALVTVDALTRANGYGHSMLVVTAVFLACALALHGTLVVFLVRGSGRAQSWLCGLTLLRLLLGLYTVVRLRAQLDLVPPLHWAQIALTAGALWYLYRPDTREYCAPEQSDRYFR